MKTSENLHLAIFSGPGTEDIVSAAVDLYCCGELSLDLVVVSPSINYDIVGAVSFANTKTDDSIIGFAEVTTWLKKNADCLVAKGRSVGWYRQQYLKLGYAWQLPGACFIHDGDTIFSRALIKSLCTSSMLLATREDNNNYDLGCQQIGIQSNGSCSFVANGGLFNGQLLRRLSTNPAEWFITAMERIVKGSGSGDFSEYQIMGNLMKAHDPDIRIHAMRFFRRMDLLATSTHTLPPTQLITQALARYDAIAFERNHRRSTLRGVLGRLRYWTGRSW
jgi:hypothetical protein